MKLGQGEMKLVAGAFQFSLLLTLPLMEPFARLPYSPCPAKAIMLACDRRDDTQLGLQTKKPGFEM